MRVIFSAKCELAALLSTLLLMCALRMIRPQRNGHLVVVVVIYQFFLLLVLPIVFASFDVVWLVAVAGGGIEDGLFGADA